MATSDNKENKARTKRIRRIENSKTKTKMMDLKNNKSLYQEISQLLSNNCLSIWESQWRKTSESMVVIDFLYCYACLLLKHFYVKKSKNF